MEGYEVRRGEVCEQVFDLSTSEGRAPEASRVIATFTYSTMEVGTCYNGLRDGFSEDSMRKRRRLGRSG